MFLLLLFLFVLNIHHQGPRSGPRGSLQGHGPPSGSGRSGSPAPATGWRSERGTGPHPGAAPPLAAGSTWPATPPCLSGGGLYCFPRKEHFCHLTCEECFKAACNMMRCDRRSAVLGYAQCFGFGLGLMVSVLGPRPPRSQPSPPDPSNFGHGLATHPDSLLMVRPPTTCSTPPPRSSMPATPMMPTQTAAAAPAWKPPPAAAAAAAVPAYINIYVLSVDISPQSRPSSSATP